MTGNCSFSRNCTIAIHENIAMPARGTSAKFQLSWGSFCHICAPFNPKKAMTLNKQPEPGKSIRMYSLADNLKDLHRLMVTFLSVEICLQQHVVHFSFFSFQSESNVSFAASSGMAVPAWIQHFSAVSFLLDETNQRIQTTQQHRILCTATLMFLQIFCRLSDQRPTRTGFWKALRAEVLTRQNSCLNYWKLNAIAAVVVLQRKSQSKLCLTSMPTATQLPTVACWWRNTAELRGWCGPRSKAVVGSTQ